MIKSNTCSKGGIKIHETHVKNVKNVEDPQEFFYNKIKNQNKHTGVRIEESKNEYNIDPFDGSNPFSNPEGDKEVSVIYNKSDYNRLDLNIDNYSQKDLYKLFGIETQMLSEDIMRTSKRIVLKTHPDKSGLEPKYFLFFSKAYKVLHGIYKFQNKNMQKIEDHNEYNIDTNILNNLFEKNKMLKNPENFNKWFNEEFDKNKLEDNDTGYAEWLKSNEDIIDMGNVSQANMGVEIEKRKKQVQALLKYEGIDTQYSSTFGGSTLMNKNENYTSNSLFNDGMNYTDLKQAYVESVIPITEDDYAKLPKFKNVEEYKRHRESVNITPLDKETSIKQLFKENKQQDEESVALAYYYATQNEKVKQKNQSFWANLKQLMN